MPSPRCGHVKGLPVCRVEHRTLKQPIHLLKLVITKKTKNLFYCGGALNHPGTPHGFLKLVKLSFIDPADQKFIKKVKSILKKRDMTEQALWLFCDTGSIRSFFITKHHQTLPLVSH